MPPPTIPDKPYFKIGEVAGIVGVATSVLRFWEREFGRDIRPERTGSNQRRYRRRDVETFLRIKALRYDEQVAVAGTKRRLRVAAGEEPAPSTRALAARIASEIEELLQVVDEDERGE